MEERSGTSDVSPGNISYEKTVAGQTLERVEGCSSSVSGPTPT